MSSTDEYRVVTRSARETKGVAKRLAARLHPGDLVSLSGDLGAGKTVFVQGLAEGLGIKERVTSPTFTIIREYFDKIPLYHFDVYRLSSAAELIDLGYEEYFFGDGISVVEWGDKITVLFPPDYLEVVFEFGGGERRALTFRPRGSRWKAAFKELTGALLEEIGE